MNSVDKFLFLPDTQEPPDLRRLPIQNVGIRGARHPMRVKVAGGAARAAAGI